MRRTISSLANLFCGVVLLTPLANADVLVNGGFEGAPQGEDITNNLNNLATGWTLSGFTTPPSPNTTTPDWVSSTQISSPFGSGDFQSLDADTVTPFTDTTNYPGGFQATIEQQVSGFTVGAVYQFSLDSILLASARDGAGGDATLFQNGGYNVLLDGVSISTVNITRFLELDITTGPQIQLLGSPVPQTDTVEFAATSSQHTISIQPFELAGSVLPVGPNDNELTFASAYIDNAELNVIPEPSTTAFALFSILLWLSARRRRY